MTTPETTPEDLWKEIAKLCTTVVSNNKTAKTYATANRQKTVVEIEKLLTQLKRHHGVEEEKVSRLSLPATSIAPVESISVKVISFSNPMLNQGSVTVKVISGTVNGKYFYLRNENNQNLKAINRSRSKPSTVGDEVFLTVEYSGGLSYGELLTLIPQ